MYRQKTRVSGITPVHPPLTAPDRPHMRPPYLYLPPPKHNHGRHARRNRCSRSFTVGALAVTLITALTIRNITNRGGMTSKERQWSPWSISDWPAIMHPSSEDNVTRCYNLQIEKRALSLPEAGRLIRLGDFALSRKEQQYLVASRSLLIMRSQEEASWDLLWSDYHGAFDQKKPANVALSIPWRTPHNPIFMVIYSKRPIRVILKETVGATAIASLPAYSRNITCPKESELDVETIDVQTAFEQPIRQANFRTRQSSSGIVTVCTQLTVDRLPRLDEMARMYQGPMSAAIYIGFRGSITEEVETVGKFWDDSAFLRQFVDVHLVFDNKKPWYATGKSADNHGHNPYPINLLRQYAVDQARTEWVLYQEADMVTVKNAHQLIVDRWDMMMEVHQGMNQSAVFVVPIYFCSKDVAADFMPSNKTEIREALHMKHMSRQGDEYQSHRKLDYEGWENLKSPAFLPYGTSGDPNEILLRHQEPYFMIRKKDMPPYNVLFMGMPGDKESQTVNTNECGFVFYLHPDLYAINFGGDTNVTDGWVNPKRRGNDGWRQALVHGVHLAYKEEVQKIKRRVEGGTLCQI